MKVKKDLRVITDCENVDFTLKTDELESRVISEIFFSEGNFFFPDLEEGAYILVVKGKNCKPYCVRFIFDEFGWGYQTNSCSNDINTSLELTGENEDTLLLKIHLRKNNYSPTSIQQQLQQYSNHVEDSRKTLESESEEIKVRVMEAIPVELKHTTSVLIYPDEISIRLMGVKPLSFEELKSLFVRLSVNPKHMFIESMNEHIIIRIFSVEGLTHFMEEYEDNKEKKGVE